MLVSRESYWLKLDRAEVHLNDLKARVAPYSKVHPCLVTSSIKTDKKGTEWEYRAFADSPDDPWFPIIVGEFLFNVRSALDHVAVAGVPAKQKRSAYFPIVQDDLWEVDELSDQLVTKHADARSGWERAVKGMTPAAIAFIKQQQPYHFKAEGKNPRDHVLAILSGLQNADKHRYLVVVADTLKDGVVRVPQPGGEIRSDSLILGPAHALKSGAIIHRSPQEADVEVEASLKVAVGGGPAGPYRDFPEAFDRILFAAASIVGKLSVIIA